METIPIDEVLKFRAVIEDAGNGGAYVRVPFDVEKVFGKKRVKVKASLGGEPYRGLLVRMGTDCHILGVRKEIREKIGKNLGDEIEVTLAEDHEAREVSVPPDFSTALAQDSAAEAFFRQLSYTHQKEYVEWIESAKRAQTRQNRIDQTLRSLREGQQTPE